MVLDAPENCPKCPDEIYSGKWRSSYSEWNSDILISQYKCDVCKHEWEEEAV